MMACFRYILKTSRTRVNRRLVHKSEYQYCRQTFSLSHGQYISIKSNSIRKGSFSSLSIILSNVHFKPQSCHKLDFKGLCIKFLWICIRLRSSSNKIEDQIDMLLRYIRLVPNIRHKALLVLILVHSRYQNSYLINGDQIHSCQLPHEHQKRHKSY